MFFRRLNFSVYYISFYRLFFFIILFYSIIFDLNSNLLICSFLLPSVSLLNLSSFFSTLLALIYLSLLLKISTTKKRNIINFILIDVYLLTVFMSKNLNKYLIFLNTNYTYFFLSNIIYYFFNIITMNSKIFYLTTGILKRFFIVNFNWYPLYKKLSYYGYFRSSRFNNAQDYEKNIFLIKN